MAKKVTVQIKESVDLVKELPTADQKKLYAIDIKGKAVEVKLSVTSTQAEIRAAEVRAVGLKQLHGGGEILKGYIKTGLAKIDGAKDEKTRKSLVKDLASQVEKVNKGTATAYLAAMEAHWKKIAKAESDGEKAVAKAEEAAKQAAKAQPKISKTQWFKLVLDALALKSTISKGVTEFQNARKSVLLAASAIDTEALRVQSEAGRGTPPAVIEKQRALLVEGHGKQFIRHATELAKHGSKLLVVLEKILRTASRVDKNAAAAHVQVKNLQFQLEQIELTVEKVKPVLKGLSPVLTQAGAGAVALLNGKVAPNREFASTLATQLDIDQDVKQLLEGIAEAGKLAVSVAKL